MRTLFVGNTGYITNEFIENAFPDSLVVVMGAACIKTDRKKTWLCARSQKMKKNWKIFFVPMNLSRLFIFHTI